MTFFQILQIVGIVGCISLLGFCAIYQQNIKTYLRLRQKIEFVLPENYIMRNIEVTLSKLLRTRHIQGVYVLYESAGSGKTIAIRKVLGEIQSDDVKSTLTRYAHDNVTFDTRINLKPMYVDARSGNGFEWEKESGKYDFDDFV